MAACSTAVAAIADLINEVTLLRGFARDLMDDWPDCGELDGGALQDLAAKWRLLASVEMPAPCSEETCACAVVLDDDEWPSTCYRRTTLLTGNPESDRSIEQLRKAPAA